MGFSSIPVYLDPPNWQQQQQQQHQLQQGLSTGSNSDLISHEQVLNFHHQHLPPLPPNPNHVAGPSSSSIRPVPMAERARLAKIHQLEGALKCPRCESTNTKFCYYNNYSFSQPRHFCKTCRRYWTRGGALRNVPVGGGCRRNKKGRSGNSKPSGDHKSNNNSTSSDRQNTFTSNNIVTDHLQGQAQAGHHSQLLASVPDLTQYGSFGLNLNGVSTINNATNSLNISDMGFLQVGSSSSALISTSNESNVFTSGVNQFSLFEPPTNLFGCFQSSPAEGVANNIGASISLKNNIGASTSPIVLRPTRVSSNQAKIEENAQLLKLSSTIGNAENSSYWGSTSTWNAATDFLAGLNNNASPSNM